jgi:predicted nucleic acid-binding protein
VFAPAAFDTNVALHAIGSDPTRTAKTRSLLRTPGVVSVQVLNEGVAVLRSAKLGRKPTRWREIDSWLNGLIRHHRIVPVDVDTHARARQYAERYRLRIFDANIVAAAVLAGCTTLWSEDMHDGVVIDGLTIRNPYR